MIAAGVIFTVAQNKYNKVADLVLVDPNLKLEIEIRPEFAEEGSRIAKMKACSDCHGKYLAASCVGCHHPNYGGGAIPGVPPSWPKALYNFLKSLPPADSN